MIIICKLKKAFLINIEKIKVLNNKADNIPKYNLRLKLDVYEKLNILVDDLINHIWRLIYRKKRVNDKINNIDANKEKDIDIYVHKLI